MDHILDAYHAPLRRDLADLEARLGTALESPSASQEQRRFVSAAMDSFRPLAHELLEHLAKEECVLFPWIRAGRGASAGGPIRVMQHEHRQAELYLQRLRHLADATQRRGSVDDVVADLMQRLAALDASLRDHIELEELMFLRVLAG
ncbi:MAG TPA: hemerythrin domain-containing protein [Piscinibacter sp.]|nr:hemerythrin domain-containing protein [Piscinibacter sp.]